MIFTPTAVDGVFVVDVERREDERGFFGRTFCRDEFTARGLHGSFEQCSVSFNHARGTLRGMHYQVAPGEEVKLVRCTRGAIYDVALDLRPGSPTFRQWVSAVLSAENRRMLYIPEGVAHGFQTVEPESEVFYQISASHRPELSRGVRWDDPSFGISWPSDERIISERDRSLPDFTA